MEASEPHESQKGAAGTVTRGELKVNMGQKPQWHKGNEEADRMAGEVGWVRAWMQKPEIATPYEK